MNQQHLWGKLHARYSLTNLPREARDILFLLLVVAWVIAPQAEHLPLWANAMVAGLLLWRGWLAWNSRPLPHRWVVAGLLVLAVGGTFLTYRTVIGRDAGVMLVVMLLTLKTLEMRARRDALVVFFLGFFTLLSHFFFSQSLLTAIVILLGLLGLLSALINAHMPVGRPPLRQSIALACRMALFGAPIMALLFVLFPRIGPLWGMPAEMGAGRSGLSGQMRVGAMASLVLSESVAMRVKWLNTPNEQPPAQSSLYFRGPVLSDFDGTQWRSTGSWEDEKWVESLSQAPQVRVQGAGIRYQVTLEPHQQPWLMLLDVAPERPEFSVATKSFLTGDLLWQSSRPVMEVLRYEATSYPQFQYGPLQYEHRLQTYTQLPANSNPRTVAWAQSLRQSLMAADPSQAAPTRAVIDTVMSRLRTGGYSYTLEPGVYGQHTADEFWFDRKEGFCEHIASSFVILMRAMDIPARIVTGYQGGAVNPIDGYWTVRQSDAHAWAEVWIQGEGWVRVDPTGAVSPGRTGSFERLRPPRGVLGGAMDSVISPSAWQNIRAVWEAANNSWNQWVLNYSPARQMELLKSWGFGGAQWTDLVKVLAGIFALGAGATAGWMALERRRQDPWLRLLQSVRHQLSRRGLNVTHAGTPRAVAQQVSMHYGDAGHGIVQWLLQLEQYRYAPKSTLSLSQLRRAWRALKLPEASAGALAADNEDLK